MAVNNKYLQMVILLLSIIVILACSLVIGPEAGQPDPSAVQTSIAFGMMSTSLAKQQMTLQAYQSQATGQAQPANLPPPTQTTSAPLQQPPTQNIQPPPQPSQTNAPRHPRNLCLIFRNRLTLFIVISRRIN